MGEKQRDMDQDDGDIEIFNLDDTPIVEKYDVFSLPHHVHFLPKQRRKQAVLTTGIVMLGLLVLLGSNVAIRNKLLGGIFPPASTLTQGIPAGTDRFYVDGDPGWGKLFVDGKPIAHIPNPDAGDAPVHVQRGVHTIKWLAEPFLPQMCIMTVPPNFKTDTCSYKQMLTNNQGGGWLFTFSVSLTNLPYTQQAALTTAVQAALQQYTGSDMVQPGEIYTTDALGLRQITAHEALKVTVHYTLDTNVAQNILCGPNFFMDGTVGCSSQGVDCRVFCKVSQGFVFKQTKTETWNVLAATHTTFTYTTLDGKPVVQTSERVDSTAQYDHLLPLQISLNGSQWHVVSSFSLLSSIPSEFPTPICDTAERKSESTTFQFTTFESSFTGMSWRFISMPDATSCLIAVTMPQDLTSVEAQPNALCLYRFGVFLAVGQLAHTYWPHMQVATQDEQRVAQQVYMSAPNS